MTRFSRFLLLFLLPTSLFAQINMAESKVQTIGYWSKNETQSYSVSYGKYKISGTDTTRNQMITYDVNITVKDSTEKNYLIEWLYTNFEVDTDNELVKKIISVAEDVPVLIRTDEFGAIQEVVNWEEVRDRTRKATDILKKSVANIPNAEALLADALNIYASKEAVEANAIKDALQFYTFHGAAYTLGEELNVKIQLPNAYGKKPFDADLTVTLTDIDEEDGNYILRMRQSVDSKPLTDATYNYLKELAGAGQEFPKRKDFPLLSNETKTASRIHGPSGWVIYTVETKTVTAEGTLNMEERIIEIK